MRARWSSARASRRRWPGIDSHWGAVVFRVTVDPAAVRIGEPHKFDELGWFAPGDLPSPLHSQLPATLALTGPDQSQRGIGRPSGTTASGAS